MTPHCEEMIIKVYNDFPKFKCQLHPTTCLDKVADEATPPEYSLYPYFSPAPVSPHPSTWINVCTHKSPLDSSAIQTACKLLLT